MNVVLMCYSSESFPPGLLLNWSADSVQTQALNVATEIWPSGLNIANVTQWGEAKYHLRQIYIETVFAKTKNINDWVVPYDSEIS